MAWRSELKKNVRTIKQLKRYMSISPGEEQSLEQVLSIHPMSVTRHYMSLIDFGDPHDPIRKIAIPSTDELDTTGSYDTSGERENTRMPGLQHKYPQTALILATNRCAVYCRHCFRKRLVGLSRDEILKRFKSAIDYIQRHESINNVLVSGGDPLVLETRVIARFLKKLSKVPHLDFIRFGSRIPAVFPERILLDPDLIALFARHSRKGRRIHLVTHFNHPREITSSALDALARLLGAGVVLHNQAVLLRGVNDRGETLARLHKKLAGIGVAPYYVFQCRPVKRVKRHFQVPLREGYEIVEHARARVNGLAKRFRYVMSHVTGKVEVAGVMGNEIYLKYHQAKHPEDTGRFFRLGLTERAGWLDDLRGPDQIPLLGEEHEKEREFSYDEYRESYPDLSSN